MKSSKGGSQRPRSRSSLSESSDDESCRQCGHHGGEQWIACDLCDAWFHEECVILGFPIEEMNDL